MVFLITHTSLGEKRYLGRMYTIMFLKVHFFLVMYGMKHNLNQSNVIHVMTDSPLKLHTSEYKSPISCLIHST